MTKKFLSIICLNCFVFSFSQSVNIPDIYFKTLLISIKAADHYAKDLDGNYTVVDLNNDGEIQYSEAENISYLSTAYENKLVDLTGIEAFQNLAELYVEHNTKLQSLHLSDNVKLKKIKGLYNQSLENIDVTNCLLLEDLDLFDTRINSIDLYRNVELKNLILTGNYTSLDLSKNLKIEKIRIGSDNLKDLNLNNCNFLSQIRIDNDNLLLFNFSQLVSLQSIIFANTKMSSMDFSSSPVAEISFWYGAQNLNSLLLPVQNSKLKSINVPPNVKTVDLSNSPNLEFFSISSNVISKLDFSKNEKLKHVSVSGSDLITNLDVSHNTNLEIFNVFRLPNLQSISVKNGKQQNFYEGFLECPRLTYVCCDESEKAYFAAKNIQTVVTDCLLATQEQDFLIDFKIYPNPASEYLFFNQKVQSVKLFDSQGKLILNKKINSYNLNVSELKNGIYILETNPKNKKSSQKFIKK